MTKQIILEVQEYIDELCPCGRGKLLQVSYLDEQGKYKVTNHKCKRCVVIDNLKNI